MIHCCKEILLLDVVRAKHVVLKDGLQMRKVNFELNISGINKDNVFIFPQKL